MRSAWKKLAWQDTDIDSSKKYRGKTFSWILFEGCKAHMLNLAARDICEKAIVKDLLKDCGEIAKFFGKKTPQLILEKAQIEQHGSSAILQAPVKTRWGTWAKLASSISANEESIKPALCAPGIQKDNTLKTEAERLRKKLCDSEDFWADVKDVEKMLAPLAEAITTIEGNEVNSRRC